MKRGKIILMFLAANWWLTGILLAASITFLTVICSFIIAYTTAVMEANNLQGGDNTGSGLGFETSGDMLYGNITTDLNSLPEWLRWHVIGYNKADVYIKDHYKNVPTTPLAAGIGSHSMETHGQFIFKKVNGSDCGGPMQFQVSSWNGGWKLDGNDDGVMDLFDSRDVVPSAYMKVYPDKYTLARGAGLQEFTTAPETKWVMAAAAYLGIAGFWPGNDIPLTKDETIALHSKALQKFYDNNGGTLLPQGLRDSLAFKYYNNPSTMTQTADNRKSASAWLIPEFTKIFIELGQTPEMASKLANRGYNYSGSLGSGCYALCAWASGQQVLEQVPLMERPKKRTRTAGTGTGQISLDSAPWDIYQLDPNSILPGTWDSKLTQSRKLTLAVAKALVGQHYSQSSFATFNGIRTSGLRNNRGQYFKANKQSQHSDCSSFVEYALFQTTGVAVGGTTVGIFANENSLFTPVAKGDLQATDLIIWRGVGSNHVVMATGQYKGNKPIVIHSPNPRKTVEITAYSVPAWAHYLRLNTQWLD